MVYYDYDDNCPFLVVNVADQPFRGLLDSGSSITILRSNSHEIFLKTGVTIHGCDDFTHIATDTDSRSFILRYFVLQAHFDNLTRILKLYVVTDVSATRVLVADFWRTFNLAPIIFSYKSLFSRC